MQEIIDLLKSRGELKIIDTPLDIYLEIPHVAYIEVKKPESKALLFTQPTKFGEVISTPVLMNLFGSQARTELLMGDTPDNIARKIEEMMHMKPPGGFFEALSLAPKLFNLKNVFPKRIKSKAACQSVVKRGAAVDLYELPILTTWEKDGGPFITMGQVYTQSLDGKMQNLGMYRLQVYDGKHLGMHWQIHKDSSHFFDQYRDAGAKMPVSIAIGGDPLYTWCATAPLPYGINELLMYGFIKGKAARLVKSVTNDLYVPEDADFVIEGWVDPCEMRDEGPFGDHTGYYTPVEPYPVLQVEAITQKENPVYLATVVGKPPLEDKYMGWATERVFLPLLKTNAPDLIDYNLPENGVFHNLILAKIKTLYPAHARQMMHVFWGVGQMSFVKHAIFVDDKAPRLEDFDALVPYILNRLTIKNLLITEGVCDALDHSSPEFAAGGKLGVDCTGEAVEKTIEVLDDTRMLEWAQEHYQDIKGLKQYYTDTANPITVIAVEKHQNLSHVVKHLEPLYSHLKIVVLVEAKDNDLENPYMLVWRVTNNIDAKRDIYIREEVIFIDASSKDDRDQYEREWPLDTDCTESVIQSLREKGVIDVDDAFLHHYHIVRSPETK